MELSQFMSILFDEGESGCFGDLYNRTVQPIINTPTEFFCVNPLDPCKDHDAHSSPLYNSNKPRRANLNVSKYRNFLFEMDSVSLEDQIIIIENCGIPFSTIVYSGGKSYHCILSLKTPLEVPQHSSVGVDLYKKDWKRLAALIGFTAERLFPGRYDKVVDSSTQNPSRLSRCPGFMRSTGKLQSIVRLGQRIEDSEYFELLKKCPEVSLGSSVVSKYLIDFEIKKVSDFWHYAPPGLRNTLKYCTWVSDTGMYPEVFKKTVWAIESTGVSKEIFFQILEETVFKKFDLVGYPKYKYRLGVESAYRYKSQRG